MVDPTAFLRRSPVRRAMPANATWLSLGDAAVVKRTAVDHATSHLGIADLSPLPRLGFRGRDTLPLLRTRGVDLGDGQPNRAYRQSGGALCLVLGAGEVFLLNGLNDCGDQLTTLATWQPAESEQVYAMPRRDSHAWFAVSGQAAPALLAKLCAVDLRPHRFPALWVAQTTLARLNAIVVRTDAPDALLYYVLADSAAALYLLSCLLDAASEFGGGLVGLETLRTDRSGHGKSETDRTPEE